MNFFILFLLAATQLASAERYTSDKGLNHTFHSGNAYLGYGQWVANSLGRIEFSFKTSLQNATLIYTAGDYGPVHVALQNGRIGCSARLYHRPNDIGPLMQGTGTGLFNDDQWHHLVLTHRTSRIKVLIDTKLEISLYSGASKHYRLMTNGRLYVGGIPLYIKLSPGSFIGCIKDVLIRDGKAGKPSLPSYEKPRSQNKTSHGCTEPCEDQSCSGGEACINDWSNGVGMCSCISLDMACLQNITKGPVSLDGTNYRCYDTYSYYEPLISSYLYLGLKPPYPHNGVLLTFYNPDSPHQRSASLYVKDSLLHFAVYSWSTSIISLLKFNDTLISGTYYQISILRNKMTVNIILTPSIGSPKTILTNEFTENSSERVCLGRGTSELFPYEGSVEVLQQGLQVYQYFEDFPLSASPLRYLPGNGSDYLSLLPNVLSKYESLSFRIWMERPGSVIHMSKDGHMLDIQLDEGSVTIDNGNFTHNCSGRSITRKGWLSVILSRPHVSKLLVTVDHFECIIDDTKWAEIIQAVADAPVNIGMRVSMAGKIFSGYVEGLRAGNMPPLCPVIV
ncbi:PREDICTED: uncharacterized protein LOC109581554 [Amphimedon queenslandica]|uniref:Laminin G domain-containing protein n=1 Tax=Amphimedon queenslandica TaxID=400682 RepID=A0A1X7V1J0_AMPQE|nr:PREDICTED: uncharacterized protein LOC109581554 [Amphimedon queenslandica]|eukprot:XP_019851338.1 PREDICTED: uncharacterized protein LOC109581554 [Amphimedon queenslandica]